MSSENLTLGEAQEIARKVRQKATEIGVNISVAVVDGSGILELLERMDGAGILSGEIARAKAYTVIAFRGRPTQDLSDLFKNNPQTFIGVSAITPVVAGGGGMPVIRSGKTVGAVGVSGAKMQEDQQCAEAAG